MGHSLVDIYLNPQLDGLGMLRSAVNNALSTLRAPLREGQQGFFTVTLTWDGNGDVDLHTFEPGNAHVYYRALTGAAGFLDVDNTVANGPEHYYASCQSDRLQPGRYRIGINNYARATGRTATVSLRSNSGGVITSRVLSVGAERGPNGDASPIPVFTVLVTMNPQTSRLEVAVE